jgi:hypothetical protein
LTEKISAGAYAQWSRVEYAPNSLYLGIDLAHQLNYRSTLEGVNVRYTLTPLTAFTVAMEQQRDRFESSTQASADSLQVIPAVEFNPHALVSGRASIGFRRFRFLTGGLPDFTGTTASVDLNYTLLGQTRFGLGVIRNLQYSYYAPDYLATQVNLSVTERLGESWEVAGSVGRARLTYGLQTASTNPGTTPLQDETGRTFAADAGYRLNRARVGFHVDYGARKPDRPEPFRRYERFRVGSTLAYAF